MSVWNYQGLMYHVGHDIACSVYGNKDNVAIICDTCNEIIMHYDKPVVQELKTPKQKCLDCGHVSDQFIQPAKVDCDALVDYKGDFQWWKSENFENPDFEEGIFMCENCYSDNLEDYKEEE